ncbi:MAG: aromatic ring-hydroxylating dioxygenase subunit alpha, partial [Alphaproteobacteria bacterium]|nr:aromatic ring-hydroxylating dioxygenase subunit alpha [Alphaproteobacteria bacterium]
MQAELQQELSRRLFAHLDAGTTDVWPEVVRQPVSAYTCPERAERENRELFRRRPLFVGLSGLLPNPGDWITSDETGIP